MGRQRRSNVERYPANKSNYRQKQERRKKTSSNMDEVVPFSKYVFKPKTDKQKQLYSAISANNLTFATGYLGTGKTHVAIAYAIPFMQSEICNKIVLTNPAVEIGDKKLGTLPGNKDEKIAIDVRPMRDILNKILGSSYVDNLVSSKRILFEPLGSILGTTFDNSIIIMDEAQNTTPEQMKILLTRHSQRSKVIICGDYKHQKFIDGKSGLEDALFRLRHLPGVAHVDFELEDIVRSDFCKEVIKAYYPSEDKEDSLEIQNRLPF